MSEQASVKMQSWQRKLVYLAAALFAVLVFLAILGERTLPLFNHDRALAGRTYKAIFTGFGGLAFAMIQPVIWPAFAHRLQQVIAIGGAQGRFADWLKGPSFRRLVFRFSWAFCFAMSLASIWTAYALWTGRA